MSPDTSPSNGSILILAPNWFTSCSTGTGASRTFAILRSSFAFLRANVYVKAIVVRSVVRGNYSRCPLPCFWRITAQAVRDRLSSKEIPARKKLIYMDIKHVGEASQCVYLDLLPTFFNVGYRGSRKAQSARKLCLRNFPSLPCRSDPCTESSVE